MEAQYVKGAIIRSQYKVSNTTLQCWANEGKIRTIRTPGKYRLYNTEDVQKLFGDKEHKFARVIYTRVYSDDQADELARQTSLLLSIYPGAEVITDIGSSADFRRQGFNTLLDRISRKEVEEVIIMYRSQMCEIAFSIIEKYCEKFGTKIVVQDKSDTISGLQEEFIDFAKLFIKKYDRLRNTNEKTRRTTIKSLQEDQAKAEQPSEASN